MSIKNCSVFASEIGVNNFRGRLTVFDSFVYNNDVGIQIGSGSVAEIKKSKIFGNEKSGVYSYNANLEISDSLFESNRDHGAYVSRGHLVVSDSTFSKNEVPAWSYYGYGGGAGLLTSELTSAIIANNTFAENKAHGRCGGGVHVLKQVSSEADVFYFYNNTISGNEARDGGGICVGGNGASTFAAYNVTITNNKAANGGGGVYISPKALFGLGNSVVSGNQAATGLNQDLGNEIFVYEDRYVSGIFFSKGSNLFGQTGKSGLANAVMGGTDKILSGRVEGALEPLADNGGPTDTHFLPPGSPAINAGSNVFLPVVNGRQVTTDQRGLARVKGGIVDIGAVEVDWDAPLISLSVSKAGNGRVLSSPAGIDCGSLCSTSYALGSQIQLAATADSGYIFAGWGGACAGTDACQLTMDADKTVLATFTPSNGQYTAEDYYFKVDAYFWGVLGRGATADELRDWGAVLLANNGSVWRPLGSGLQAFLSNHKGWDSAPLDRAKAEERIKEVLNNLFDWSEDLDPRISAYYIDALLAGSVKERGLVNAVLNDLAIMPKADGSHGQPAGWQGGPSADLLTQAQFERYRTRIKSID